MTQDGGAATILDVARLAGVSKTTASDALRGYGRVSQATRDTVSRAADRLGYTPNRSARSLRTATTETIGLHIPEVLLRSEYYMSFVFGVVDEASASGYDVTMITSDHPPRQGRMPHVDGLVLCDPVANDPMTDSLIGTDLPVVTCERYPGGARTAGTVWSDHGGMTVRLLDGLLAAGASRPAMLMPVTVSDWSVTLRATYESWCRERGVEGVEREVSFGSPVDMLRETVSSMLNDETSVDALVCAADGSAVAAMPAVRASGRRIGDDFLLASCVDSSAMQIADPSITAIDTKPRESGAACARLLFEVLAGDADPGAEREVPIDLHLRPSTHKR